MLREIDILRIATIAAAVVAMVLMIARAARARRRNGDHFAPWATASLCTFGVFTVLVQIRQIGHPPLTWWGLPLLAVAVLLMCVALWRSKV